MNPNDILSFVRDWTCIFVIAFVIAVFILLSILQSRRNRRHFSQLQRLAANNGWRFYKTFDFPFLGELGLYSGKSEKGWLGGIIENPLTVPSKNVIQGNLHGRSFAVFEQTYRRAGSERSYDVTQTLLAVELADMNLPIFCLEPDASDQFFTHIFEMKTSKLDIDFPAHPKFSRMYLLYGQDERSIRSLFKPPVLSFYEQYPAFTTVAGGKYLVIYSDAALLPAEHIAGQLDFLFALADAFRKGR